MRVVTTSRIVFMDIISFGKEDKKRDRKAMFAERKLDILALRHTKRGRDVVWGFRVVKQKESELEY